MSTRTNELVWLRQAAKERGAMREAAAFYRATSERVYLWSAMVYRELSKRSLHNAHCFEQMGTRQLNSPELMPKKKHHHAPQDRLTVYTKGGKEIPLWQIDYKGKKPYYVHKDDCVTPCGYSCNPRGFRLAGEIKVNGGTSVHFDGHVPKLTAAAYQGFGNRVRQRLGKVWRLCKAWWGFS